MKQKKLLSLFIVALFVFFAIASKVNKMHVNAFAYGVSKEDDTEKGNYLVKNDGTKVHGQKIKWKSGTFVKDRIGIDDNVFPMKEVVGYKSENNYYHRFGSEYIQRIVHGKINVYVVFSQAEYMTTDANGRSRTHHYTRAVHYSQKGEDGGLAEFANQKDIKELVADCPLAVALADLSDRQMRKAIKKNRRYMNNIFETYNNDCKAVE